MESNHRVLKTQRQFKKEDKNHFESGTYEFNRIILNWSFEKISRPFKLLTLLPPKYSFPIKPTSSYINFDITKVYDDNIYDEYYDSFKLHILEEARAVIATGLEALKNSKLKAFTLTVRHINIPKNSSNPTSIKAGGKLPKETEGRSCLALRISLGKRYVFAIGTEEGIDTGIFNIKLIADDDILNERQFNAGQIWQAYVLGSLVSHQRMYEVCTLKPKVKFLKNIVSGNLPAWDKPIISSIPPIKIEPDLTPKLIQPSKSISLLESVMEKFSSLWITKRSSSNTSQNNPQQIMLNSTTSKVSENSASMVALLNQSKSNSTPKLAQELIIHEAFKAFNKIQQSIAQKFLDTNDGLYVLQGPPGTGKTTAIVGILKALADKNKRIMLCAPSNKAVQVIATRFLEKYPEVKMALAGVESKLAENLREIFIQGWNIFIAEQISQYKGNLLRQLNIKQLLNLNLVKQPEALKIDVLNKLAKIPEISIANITNLVSLRAPHCYKNIYNNLILLVKEVKQYKEKFQLMVEKIEPEELQRVKSYYLNNNNTKQPAINSAHDILKPALIEKCETALNSIKYYLEDIIDTICNTDLELDMLNNAHVIFCTLSVAGRNMMRGVKDIDVLIVDEAGQTVEAETLIPFALHPKKCLLVGDVNQLPATVISPEAERNNFGWSMMWRLLNECKQSYELLKIQYRMHAQIRQWPSAQYYQNMLQDGETIANRQQPYQTQNNFLFTPYSFVNISSNEEQGGTSFINRKEALAIIDTLKYLKYQTNMPIDQHIGIISFYAGQVELLKSLIKKEQLGHVRIHTVDGFQGDENDMILISFVRANHRANVGFLKDFRRLNVAITRPKHSLIMFGNLPTLEKAHNSDVAKLVADIKQRNVIYTEQQLTAITKFPESTTHLVKQSSQNNNHSVAEHLPTSAQPSAKKAAAAKKPNRNNADSAKIQFYKPKQQKQDFSRRKQTSANIDTQLSEVVTDALIKQSSQNNKGASAQQPPAPIPSSAKKAVVAKKFNSKTANSTQSHFYKRKQQTNSSQNEVAAVNTKIKLVDPIPQHSAKQTLPNNNYPKHPPAPVKLSTKTIAPKKSNSKNTGSNKPDKTHLYRPKPHSTQYEEASVNMNNTNSFNP